MPDVRDSIEVIAETLYEHPTLALLGTDDCEAIALQIAQRLASDAQGGDEWLSGPDHEVRIGARLLGSLRWRGHA